MVMTHCGVVGLRISYIECMHAQPTSNLPVADDIAWYSSGNLIRHLSRVCLHASCCICTQMVTPNLERLAKRSVNFHRAYAQQV